MPSPLTVWAVMGTRPEVIKLWPVVLAARDRPEWRIRVISTGQQRELVRATLSWMGLVADADLDVMEVGQPPARVAARVMERLDALLAGDDRRLAGEVPDLLLVQGDTTSAWAAAMAGFYRRVPVAHVEAGLRTGDRHCPFPEEVHRRLISHIADMHFAPTERAQDALLQEGVPADRVKVVGNTVVDAIQRIRERFRGRFHDRRLEELFPEGRRVVLLTTHRRESWGRPLQQVYEGIRRVVDAVPDLAVVFPVHVNPVVQAQAAALRGHPRIHLIEPPLYPDFVEMMARSYLIMTDSGGIQEEAPSLGKPVLVLRERTERLEGIEAGWAQLIGLNPEKIETALRTLLDDEGRYERMRAAHNPYGDGQAAMRIVQWIEVWSGWRADRPASSSAPRAMSTAP